MPDYEGKGGDCRGLGGLDDGSLGWLVGELVFSGGEGFGVEDESCCENGKGSSDAEKSW